MYSFRCYDRRLASGRRSSFYVLVSILSLLFTVSIWAQSTASITGVIRDSSKAVIPGAEVTVASKATGLIRQTRTAETGTYRVTNLPPAVYTVSTSMPGFKTTAGEVEVTVGEVAHVELTLELGEITDQVIVDNAATPVEVEQGRVSSLVDEKRIQDLPLNGRNVYQLMHLTPGAVNTEATVFEFGQSTNVNGGRTNMNGFWMDGISSTGLSGGTGLEEFTGAQPSLEAIQEFRIETLNFSAEFGNSAASIVNVVSKSGSNELHGSVFWFHRNDALDAREFFDEEKPPYRHNQFGFSLGGPIVRDKTFFFGSYEGTRIQTGESRVQPFESRAWSGYVAKHGSPVASFLYADHPAPELDKVRTTVGQFLTENGRFIDEAPWWVPYIDSPDQASVDAFLSETFGSAPGDLSADAPMTGEASFFTPEGSESDGFNLRIDQELGQSDTLYGRYFGIYTDAQDSRPRPALSPDDFGWTHLGVLNWTHIFSPNMINEARTGLTRYTFDHQLPQPGIPWIGDTSWLSVFGQGVPQVWRESTYTVADTLSITKGDHALKLGAEVRRSHENSEFNLGRPSYYFFDLVYLALDDPYYQAGGVNPHLDEGPGHAELASNFRGWRGTEIGLFLNDDWKFRPNLTLNLGVRWDWYGRLTEVQNRATAFDMSIGDDIFERVYHGSFIGPVDKLSDDDWNNVAPRLGVAWDPSGDGTMSIRAGYGIAFQNQIFNPLSNSRWNKPFYSFSSVVPLYGIGNSILYGPQDGSPVRAEGGNPNPGASQMVGNIIAFDPSNPHKGPLTAVPNPRMRDPYVQSFFIGIQWELFRDTTVEANYVGTLGRKLIRAEDFNRYPGDLLGEPNPVSGEESDYAVLNRINPNEGSLRFWENSVNSNYHSLQIELNRRYATGLAVATNYTLAKSLDTRSTYHSGGTTSNWRQEGFSTDVYNQRLDYGRSIFDARHRFTANWLWDMAWLQFSDSWFLKNVLGGWQINGIVALQSGQPFTPYCDLSFWRGCEWNADGWQNDRPNTPAVGNSISSERSDFVNPNGGIFDIPSSDPDRPPNLDDKLEYFGVPELGTNGDLGRNTYEGPGFASVDFSLFKIIPMSRISEEARLQFRVEFFNLFNRVNFHQPEPGIHFPTFGRAAETFDAREIQLGVKFIF